MKRFHTFDGILERLGESFPSRIHRNEQRVATHGRQHTGLEHGGHRRGFVEGAIAVPDGVVLAASLALAARRLYGKPIRCVGTDHGGGQCCGRSHRVQATDARGGEPRTCARHGGSPASGHRIRTGYGPENTTRLRRFAIELIKARGLNVAETLRRLNRNVRCVLDFLKMSANCQPKLNRLNAAPYRHPAPGSRHPTGATTPRPDRQGPPIRTLTPPPPPPSLRTASPSSQSWTPGAGQGS